jgi:hypothetical protein
MRSSPKSRKVVVEKTEDADIELTKAPETAGNVHW